MVNAELLLSEWTTLCVHNALKDHLDPNCPRATDKHRTVNADQYPPSHVDLCSFCESRFERWRSNIDGADGDCERCGGETSVPPRYHAGIALCDGCYQQVTLGR